MKLNRRNFLKTAIGAGAISAFPVMFHWAASCRKKLFARPGASYPGNVKPLNHKKIREVGKWLG